MDGGIIHLPCVDMHSDVQILIKMIKIKMNYMIADQFCIR